VFLDPAVATRLVTVERTDSFLEILERLRTASRKPGEGWTWMSGATVITTTRDKEAVAHLAAPSEDRAK
jgi:hypothetical protein